MMDIKKLLDELGHKSYEAFYTIPTSDGSGDCMIVVSGYRKPAGVMEGQSTFSSTGNVLYKKVEAPTESASITVSGCCDIQPEGKNMIMDSLELTSLIVYGKNGTGYYVNLAEKKITSNELVTKELTDKLREEYGLSYVPVDEFETGMGIEEQAV